jgi:hypothetical protein
VFAHLTSTCFSVFLLDLHFADVARVLNDLGDICLVSPTYFSRDTLGQICKAAVHPVLPEDTDAIAERRKVGRNHTEGSVNGPEDEEDDE